MSKFLGSIRVFKIIGSNRMFIFFGSSRLFILLGSSREVFSYVATECLYTLMEQQNLIC